VTDIRLLSLIDRHYRLKDRDATNELTSRFGSPLAALLHAGDELRLRSEEISQVDISVGAKEWNEGHEQFLRDSHARLRHFTASLSQNPPIGLIELKDQKRRLNAFARIEKLRADAAGYGVDDRSAARLGELARAYETVLAVVRAPGAPPLIHPQSSPKNAAIVSEAAKCLPRWLTSTAGADAPLVAGSAKQRACYSPESGGRSELVVEPPVLMDQLPNYPGSREVRRRTDGRFEVQPLEASQDSRMPSGQGWRRNSTTIDHQWKGFGNTIQCEPGSAWIREARGELPGPAVHIDRKPASLPGRRDGFGAALHEIGHWLEDKVPGILEAEIDWLNSRHFGPDIRLDRRGTEIARGGDFPDPYVGKRYPPTVGDHDACTATEVLSCALQMMFGGSRGGLLGWSREVKDDRGMRSWTLGILASIGISDE
jgi:hypothetical protein